VKDQQFVNYGAVKNYKLAKYANDYVVFLQEETKPVPQDSVENGQDSSKAKGGKPQKETILRLANLANRETISFDDVNEFYISPKENYIIYSKKYLEKDSLKTDILHVYDIENKVDKTISTGKGTYKEFTFDEAERKLVFLADKSPEKSLTKDFKVYYYDFEMDTAEVLIDKEHSRMPLGWYVSGDGNLRFDAGGERLLLGLAPIPPIKDTTLVEFEHAVLDIWHWQDESLMTQQLANLKRDMAKNYDAIYSFSNNSLTPLLDETYDRVSYVDSVKTDWGLTTKVSLEDKIASQWLGYSRYDLYLVSLQNGDKKQVRSNFVGQYYWSPNGNYVILFDSEGGHWLSYNVKEGSMQNLTGDLAVDFTDEENDMPAFARSYGIAGWGRNDSHVYLYDRYDIWSVDLENGKKYCLTKGFGRKSKIQLRVVYPTQQKLKERNNYIDLNSDLLLSSFNIEDKRRGFFVLEGKSAHQPKEIIQSTFTYDNIAMDEEGKTFIYSKENFEQSPDLYRSANFAKEQRLTDINPQQGDYNWGTAELVHWTTPQGFEAEGILYKPENFDPTKKYPIIAYFYETLTEGLYRYQAPAPTPSRLNIPFFVSNEYLVFCPDIRYDIGHPGKSAEEYVNSGMRYMARQSWVDSTRMGIQGQSWGGYQVAHLITRTDMYAAAWTGAPVVNMTSAYGGIRWQTGMSRQFQYEHTQSRIGGTLWDNLDLYIENSPLFFLDRVNTPVVIMSNDNDGAVPWYQGIEMFTALRRLGKPSWLLNYNKDEHNLMQRQNRKDIQIREQQFFDHFLKGKDAPLWIDKGVLAKDKGVYWGFD
jgi:dipeptidyl aminopeptidase/acylaminoacyl peptidase